MVENRTERDLLYHSAQSSAVWGSYGMSKELPHLCIKASWDFCPDKTSGKAIPEMHFLDSQDPLLISS